MGTVTIEHGCGHPQDWFVVGKYEESEEYKCWLRMSHCTTCRRAEVASVGLVGDDLVAYLEETLVPLCGSPKSVRWAKVVRARQTHALLTKLETENLIWILSHVPFREERGEELARAVALLTPEGMEAVKFDLLPVVYEWLGSRWRANWWLNTREDANFVQTECAKAIAHEAFVSLVAITSGEKREVVSERAAAQRKAMEAAQEAVRKASEERRVRLRVEALICAKSPVTHHVADIEPAWDGIAIAFHDDSETVRQIQARFGFVWDCPHWINREANQEEQAVNAALALLKAGISVRMMVPEQFKAVMEALLEQETASEPVMDALSDRKQEKIPSD